MTQILQSSYNARGRLDWSISLRQGAMERTSCWPLHAGWSRWISGCLQQSPMRNCRGPARAKTTWHVTKGLMTLAGGGGGRASDPLAEAKRGLLSRVSPLAFVFVLALPVSKVEAILPVPYQELGGAAFIIDPLRPLTRGMMRRCRLPSSGSKMELTHPTPLLQTYWWPETSHSSPHPQLAIYNRRRRLLSGWQLIRSCIWNTLEMLHIYRTCGLASLLELNYIKGPLINSCIRFNFLYLHSAYSKSKIENQFETALFISIMQLTL